MSIPSSMLDTEAPLPYVRKKNDFKPDNVKFEFEREHQATRTVTTGDEEQVSTIIELRTK